MLNEFRNIVEADGSYEDLMLSVYYARVKQLKLFPGKQNNQKLEAAITRAGTLATMPPDQVENMFRLGRWYIQVHHES